VLIPVVINCKKYSFETAFSTSTASFEAIEFRVANALTEKNGFVTATKLGTTNNFFVAATKLFFITHIMIAPNGQSPQRSYNSLLQDRT